MTSILFVIGIQLKSYQTPEQAIGMLKSEPLNTLFINGLRLVQQKKAICRRLQKRILNHLLATPNVYYRSTIADGINGFFKLYRPQFAAQEIHITADYPVFMGRPQLEGIEFIEKYLRCIQAENAFCVCFAPQDIHHLLCGLTEDYRSVPLNIFEPVLLSALGLIIRNRSPLRLNLTEKDISIFYSIANMEQPRSKDEVPTMMLAAAYVISEMKTGFSIGFLIYIPFLIVDMVVSSILLAMGMMMLPPMMVSMPFKLLLFVMVDGWNLLIGSLVNSFMT